MITERELLKAIKECESEPITPSKCDKLANFYIIYDHLFGVPEPSKAREVEYVISTNGNSAFLKIIDGMNADKVWKVMDELVETIRVINPRLYDGVMRKLDD